MSRLKFLERILTLLKNPNNPSFGLSRGNTHLKGIFSLVIDGEDFGQLTRLYIVDRKIEPFAVQLHTHRYPIILTTIKGEILHHEAKPILNTNEEGIQLSEFEYRSPLNKGNGLTYAKESKVKLNEYRIPHFAKVHISEFEFHTVSCSEDSIWIIQEQGFKTEFNRVLGVPFETENLYDVPSKETVKKYAKRVIKEIELIINAFRK